MKKSTPSCVQNVDKSCDVSTDSNVMQELNSLLLTDEGADSVTFTSPLLFPSPSDDGHAVNEKVMVDKTTETSITWDLDDVDIDLLLQSDTEPVLAWSLVHPAPTSQPAALSLDISSTDSLSVMGNR